MRLCIPTGGRTSTAMVYSPRAALSVSHGSFAVRFEFDAARGDSSAVTRTGGVVAVIETNGDLRAVVREDLDDQAGRVYSPRGGCGLGEPGHARGALLRH